MTIIKIAIKNLLLKPLSSALSVVLFATSIAIILLLALVSTQLDQKFQENRDNVHMVVGAPGSRLDLILSSVYHVSPPIQNINVKDIAFILRDPSVSVVPIALGDHLSINRNGESQQRRIVGTDSSYIALYGAELEEGKVFSAPMEVTIGAEVAELGFKIGDTFVGTHGVGGEGGHVHEDEVYTVVGILKPSGTVLDQLVMCSIQSVWLVHEGHDDHGARSTTKKKESQPPLPNLVSGNAISTDSLNLLIRKKIENIEAIGISSSSSNSSLLRVRSNLKAISNYGQQLAQAHVKAKDTTGRISVKDSFKLAAGYDEAQFANLLSQLKAEVNKGNHYNALRIAYELEGITYNLRNGVERVKHDSIVQARRAMMQSQLQSRNNHYLLDHQDEEITSLLITFEGGRGLEIQRIISEYYPQLNAALVEVEVLKLYELIEPAVEYIKLLAYFIMLISGISIFISLFRTLRERKYEMALLRVLGASRLNIFVLVLAEGIFLSLAGFIAGTLLGHLLTDIMSFILNDKYHYDFTGWIFLPEELDILFVSVGIGFAAAFVPALLAMKANISATLSEK